MIEPPVIKRTLCSRCARPTRNCICALVASVPNIVELLVLQHPGEAANSKNTAGLLHMCLTTSQLRVGERYCPSDLHSWLFSNQKQPLLLYPEIPDHGALGLAAAHAFTMTDDLAANQLRLVVIDATWRKSRKMLYLNPVLQSLPRMALLDAPPSIYTIRKAHRENQLSTLEATCYALPQLETREVDYAPVLMAMRRFVAQQSAFVPHS